MRRPHHDHNTGITATPVIDLLTGPHGTIYVVAMSKNATSYFQRLHALDLTTGGPPFSLSVLGRLGALWLGGSLSDRWGRMRVLTPGLLIYAALLGSMSLLTHPMLLGVWSFAIGAAAGVVAAVPTALMSDQVQHPLQGVAIGWLRTMTDGGQIVGPLVMGFLADAIDLSAPFLFGAALLAGTAWQCRRQAGVMSDAITVGGRDS